MCTKEPTLDSLKKLMANADHFNEYTTAKYLHIADLERYRKTLKTYQTKAALKHNNLNRYCDILPYDESRVVLCDPSLGQSDEDYINASYIRAPHIDKLYIAAQGPLRRTVVDFWRMIVENKAPVIVCLTAEFEGNKKKCERYWPLPYETLEPANEIVKLKVYQKTEEWKDTEADCIVREIIVEFYQNNAEEKLLRRHEVFQLQFLAWADHGVPKDTTKVINLIKLARQFIPPHIPPMVVHCSAGCGRTGTFMVIDIAEALLRARPYTAADPIAYVTSEIRKARTTMVQTLSQFDFCYRAAVDFASQEEPIAGDSECDTEEGSAEE